MFLCDVTKAMLVSLNKGTAAMLVSQLILWELNPILMITFSFALVENMLIDHVSENNLFVQPCSILRILIAAANNKNTGHIEDSFFAVTASKCLFGVAYKL